MGSKRSFNRPMRLLLNAVAVLILAGLLLSPSSADAKRVDCAKVMKELSTGKKVKDVAKDLGISRSSVYRCRRRAKAKATGTKKKESKRKSAAATK